MTRPARSRWARRVLVLGAAGIVCWIGSGLVAATLLTRRPAPPFEEPPPAGYEAVRLRARDGTRIGAWRREHPRPRAGVVLVHGNGSSRTALADEADALHELGCTVLPISVRAHGDSEGEHNDIGWSARHDVAAAVDHLHRRCRGCPLLVYGSSLGAAAALYAAPHLGARVRGYVLVAPFADLREAVRRRTRRYLPFGLELVAYGALRIGGLAALPDIDRMRPIDSAARVSAQARAIVLAGTSDERAPLDDARQIAARMPHARVVPMPGLDHEQLGDLVHRAEWREIVTFVDEAAGRAGR